MQKIFIILEDRYTDDQEGNFSNVNEFMKDKGFIVNVYPQEVAGGDHNRGRWLVVADDGLGDEENKLLP